MNKPILIRCRQLLLFSGNKFAKYVGFAVIILNIIQNHHATRTIQYGATVKARTICGNVFSCLQTNIVFRKSIDDCHLTCVCCADNFTDTPIAAIQGVQLVVYNSAIFNRGIRPITCTRMTIDTADRRTDQGTSLNGTILNRDICLHGTIRLFAITRSPTDQTTDSGIFAVRPFLIDRRGEQVAVFQCDCGHRVNSFDECAASRIGATAQHMGIIDGNISDINTGIARKATVKQGFCQAFDISSSVQFRIFF